MTDEKIKNSNELEFVVFCIENVAEKLGVGAERVYQAFTEKSDILNGYIVPEYEVLHTQSREYIIDDLLDVMKERGSGSMILYHGSFLEIAKPDLAYSRLNVDFGRGFYVTPLYEQAAKWCGKFKRRGKDGIVSRYKYDKSREDELKILKFDSYSEEWLDFILNCRSGKDSTDYDLVVGGVANDKVFNTVELFFDGLIDKTEAINRLRYEKPNLQICFRTEKALSLLRFEGVNVYDSEPYLLQKKYSRVIECFAKLQGISLDAALEFFYHSEVYQLIRDGVSDMHCMSDAYLAEELKQEYTEKMPDTREKGE